jgi:hypothetical protein
MSRNRLINIVFGMVVATYISHVITISPLSWILDPYSLDLLRTFVNFNNEIVTGIKHYIELLCNIFSNILVDKEALRNSRVNEARLLEDLMSANIESAKYRAENDVLKSKVVSSNVWSYSTFLALFVPIMYIAVKMYMGNGSSSFDDADKEMFKSMMSILEKISRETSLKDTKIVENLIDLSKFTRK